MLGLGKMDFAAEDLNFLLQSLKMEALTQYTKIDEAVIVNDSIKEHKLAKFSSGPDIFFDPKFPDTFSAIWHFKIERLSENNPLESIMLKYVQRVRNLQQITDDLKIVLDYGHVYNLVEYWQTNQFI